VFAINAAWLELTMVAADRIGWTQTTLLTADLAKAEPKNCATDCCTSPPGPPEDSGNSSSGSPSTGPGTPNSPPPSPGSPPLPLPLPLRT
jgi:hypothetical protein